jgi:hypothetical protein
MYNDEFDVELSEDELLSPVELGNAYQEGLDGTERHFDFSGQIGMEGVVESHNARKSAHPGFKSVQASIAKRQGVSKERAGAMLAAGTRRASKKAKKANPRLKRVRGKA